MTQKILDLHIHSKYARACSPLLELPTIAEACVQKGVDIVATGDFTHPQWFKHLSENLVEENQGLYVLKNIKSPVRFIVGTEISCIYKHKDKVRRLHLLVLAPSLKAAGEFNQELEAKGCNLRADGRPILGVTGKEIVQICLNIDPRMMIIPAHAWTPWFAVFGSKSGYDSLEECFEDLTPEIFAIETGMSSDPTMNRRLTKLDNIVMVSNSDAHSLDNLGREANVFNFKNEADITYNEIRRILKTGDKNKFAYTIEFYPEEGMYHYDGHRDCKVSFSPTQTKKLKEICPVCKKNLTVGVLNRVDKLADRAVAKIPTDKFIPHRYIVPLREVIGSVFGVSKKSKKVDAEYQVLIKKLGSEFHILLNAPEEDIKKATNLPAVAEAILNMRLGKVKIEPGYDGVYGKVEVMLSAHATKQAQAKLFD